MWCFFVGLNVAHFVCVDMYVCYSYIMKIAYEVNECYGFSQAFHNDGGISRGSEVLLSIEPALLAEFPKTSSLLATMYDLVHAAKSYPLSHYMSLCDVSRS